MIRTLALLAMTVPAAAVALAGDGRLPDPALFVRVDRDSDGFVTSREARGHRPLVATFGRIDRNLDRRLSRSEFYRYLTRVKTQRPDRPADRTAIALETAVVE